MIIKDLSISSQISWMMIIILIWSIQSVKVYLNRRNSKDWLFMGRKENHQLNRIKSKVYVKIRICNALSTWVFQLISHSHLVIDSLLSSNSKCSLIIVHYNCISIVESNTLIAIFTILREKRVIHRYFMWFLRKWDHK